MPVANDSSTGGPLRPLAQPAPLTGRDLADFVQAFVVGITGMDPKLVRPAWQPEPPNIPDAATSWAAVALTQTASDTFAYVGQLPPSDTYPLGAAELQNNELIDVLSSFYDLGDTGDADRLSSLLRDGLMVPQNLEALIPQGMNLTEVGRKTVVPTLLKTRWLYRVDLPFVLARNVTRVYPIKDLAGAEGSVVTDEGLTITFRITNP